jgi:hypothetical protein
MSTRNRDLARLARETARESSGMGDKAWTAVAVALDQTGRPEAAADVLRGMITDSQLRILALACLRSLCDDSAQTP